MSSGQEKVKIKLRRPKEETESKWVVQKSRKHPGQPYYFNEKTGERRWTPPPDGAIDENVTGCDKKIEDRKPASPQIPSDQMTAGSVQAPISSITKPDDLPRSAPPKRKPSSFVRDLFNSGAEGINYRPDKKRLRQSRADQQQVVQPDQFQAQESPVNFSFKIPIPTSTNLPYMDLTALPTQPMDTSAPSYFEDERMSPVPVSSQGDNPSDAVESMDVDEFVEEVNQLRKDAQGKFSKAAPMNELSTDWDTVLAEMVMWNMVVIVDTNILLSGLSFVRDLDARSQNGLLRIVVPYTVIRELDFLKIDQTSVMKRREHNSLVESARAAIAWISDQLAKGPRSNVIFQPGYADRNGLPEFEVTCADDRILKCALEISSRRRDSKSLTVLCTNDKNLLNKAKINCQACASKKEIESYLQRLQETSVTLPHASAIETLSRSTEDALMAGAPPKHLDQSHNQMATGSAHGQNDIQIPAAFETTNEVEMVIDSCKRALTTVAENETKRAFGELWSDVIKVKPPWHTLADVLNVMLQHWVAVFRFIFTKESKELLEELYKDARHAVTFGYGQIGISILSRLLPLFGAIGRKVDNRTLISQVSGRIQQLLSSSSGQ